MSDKESDQRRDELLLRLLRMPPEPRAERKRPRRKLGDDEINRARSSESSTDEKPSAHQAETLSGCR